MKRSTALSTAIVCAVIGATAVLSLRLDKKGWVTEADPATADIGDRLISKDLAANLSIPENATESQRDAARVHQILLAEKNAILNEDIDLFERVALAAVASQDDPVQAPRWALALAGDMPFNPPPTPEQALRLKALVIACLDHNAWRMRRVAIGFCWGNRWLVEPDVRRRVEQIAQSDPAAQAKLAANRALEQFDKAEAYRKNVGPP